MYLSCFRSCDVWSDSFVLICVKKVIFFFKQVNPCGAEFFSENKNIFTFSIIFLNTKMVQVV